MTHLAQQLDTHTAKCQGHGRRVYRRGQEPGTTRAGVGWTVGSTGSLKSGCGARRGSANAADPTLREKEVPPGAQIAST